MARTTTAPILHIHLLLARLLLADADAADRLFDAVGMTPLVEEGAEHGDRRHL